MNTSQPNPTSNLEQEVADLKEQLALRDSVLHRLYERDMRIADLSSKQDDEMDQLDNEHERVLDKLEEKQDREMEKLTSRHTEELKELVARHERQMEALEQEYADIFDGMDNDEH